MYALKLWGIGPFPRFIDSLKTMETVNEWLRAAKRYLGMGRKLVRTVIL